MITKKALNAFRSIHEEKVDCDMEVLACLPLRGGGACALVAEIAMDTGYTPAQILSSIEWLRRDIEIVSVATGLKLPDSFGYCICRSSWKSAQRKLLRWQA